MYFPCITCQNPTNKYKCPICLERYCSLNCYKEHREVKCEAKQSQSVEPVTTRDGVDNEPTLHDPFTTEDTVSREKLEALKTCEGLRNLLYNPHLRNLLQEIDVAPSAWKAISAAMQEPLFLEFADECLKVVEPTHSEDVEK